MIVCTLTTLVCSLFSLITTILIKNARKNDAIATCKKICTKIVLKPQNSTLRK